MRVSILVLTIDRFNITPKIVTSSLRNAGYPYDLCISDNGSTDSRIIKWGMSMKPKLYLKNGVNKGTTQALNEMVAKHPADAYVFLGNDVEMPRGWLAAFVKAAKAIPNAGMIGIDWRNVMATRPVSTIGGVKVHLNTPEQRVFGTTFITQKVLDKIGSFCEDYGPYGLWDSDCSIRCNMAGFKNMYLYGLKSIHKGSDVGQKSAYRKMKDDSIHKALPIFSANVKRYTETGNIFIPNKNIIYGEGAGV